MRIRQFDDPVKQAHFEEIIKNPEQFAIYIDAKYYDPNRDVWVPIDKSFIVQNSTKFSLQASDTTDISIGGVYIGQAEFTVDMSFPVPADEFRDKRVSMNFMFYDPTRRYQEWEDYPISVFKHRYTVSNSVDSEKGITLTLVDDMARFDKNLPLSYAPSGDLYLILQKICEKCDVALGMTAAEVHALPNGSEVWGFYPESDCETYRDVLHYISQACAGFCYIDEFRNGGLVIRSYAEQADYDVLEAANRIKGANLASYATQITACYFTNADGSIETIGSPYLGKVYDCGFNPFLIYGQRVTLERMRTAVFNVLYSMRFKPFTAKVIIPPIYDLGDKLFFTGGSLDSNGYFSCVQKIEWSQQGLVLSGFGKNPKVAADKKSNSKAVSQATRASEVVIRKWGNYDPISVGSSEMIVTSIDFSALRAGVDVEMWHELLCDVNVVSAPMTVTAYYYLDGVLLDRRPVETFSESGEHILDLHYAEMVEDAGVHRWIVKLACSGGTIDFDQYDILSVLRGQGLEKDVRWTGLIVCSDVVAAYELPMAFAGLNDDARVVLQDFALRVLSDSIVGLTPGVDLQTIMDNCRVVLRYGDHILRCGRGDRCGLGRTFGGLT